MCISDCRMISRPGNDDSYNIIVKAAPIGRLLLGQQVAFCRPRRTHDLQYPGPEGQATALICNHQIR